MAEIHSFAGSHSIVLPAIPVTSNVAALPSRSRPCSVVSQVPWPLTDAAWANDGTPNTMTKRAATAQQRGNFRELLLAINHCFGVGGFYSYAIFSNHQWLYGLTACWALSA